MAMAYATVTPMINHASLGLFNRSPQFRPHALSSLSVKTLKATAGVAVSSAVTEVEKKPRKRSFVEEMRFAAMKLHTKDEAKEGEREPTGPPISEWEPRLDGYLKFLVDSALVYCVLETAIDTASFPEYAEVRKSGLERSERLAKDLEWFKKEGYEIPEATSLGINYAQYLQQLSEKEPHAFICHFYMINFGQTAGGRRIGEKVEKSLLGGKELEFYKYDGNLSQILHNVRIKLNKIGEGWSKEEKDRCLKETAKAIMSYEEIIRLIMS